MPLVARGTSRGTAHEGDVSVRRDRARFSAPFCFIARRADDSRVSRDARLYLIARSPPAILRFRGGEKAAAIAGHSIGRRSGEAPNAFSMSPEAPSRNPRWRRLCRGSHAANFVPRLVPGRAHGSVVSISGSVREPPRGDCVIRPVLRGLLRRGRAAAVGRNQHPKGRGSIIPAPPRDGPVIPSRSPIRAPSPPAGGTARSSASPRRDARHSDPPSRGAGLRRAMP